MLALSAPKKIKSPVCAPVLASTLSHTSLGANLTIGDCKPSRPADKSLTLMAEEEISMLDDGYEPQEGGH